MDFWQKPLPALTTAGQIRRAAVMRADAAQAFHRLSVSDKLRRALLRRQPVLAEYIPGQPVYFWTPGVASQGRTKASTST
eukprot:4455837-Amphidinium_carterae.2